MKLKEPKNINYSAIVVEIKTLVPLENCDNVQGAIIMGNQVVVSKNVKIGDIGLYFPLECALSKEYLSNNNLYRIHKNKPNLNVDTNAKGGYFEENGRVRCARFLGHKSEGFFMPLDSLYFIYDRKGVYLNVGDCFDELNDVPICSKYVVKQSRTPGSKKIRSTKKYKSKLVENQFRLHQNTSMLYRNLHRIKPDSLISITYKLHGTSGVSSYVLCKRNVTKRERVGAFFNNIYTRLVTLGKSRYVTLETEYDYIYSSRRVIKNEELNPNAQHYYNVDIWGIAHNELKPFLQKGMSMYYEIVGYLPSGGLIQKDYDYGFKNPIEHGSTKHTLGFNYGIFIYRITYTNNDGKVFEFSAKQVQDFCKKNGLNAVPELYYGYAKDLVETFGIVTAEPYFGGTNLICKIDKEFTSEEFLDRVKQLYNEKDCYMCSTPQPEEGVVIRIEGTDFEAYKAKSERFYQKETAQLDKGELNIEDEN